MYQIESSGDVIKNKRGLLSSRLAWLSVSQTVIGLGVTSFLTDISSEMVAVTLPIYLITVLRLAPLQLGIIDGLYQGAAVIVKIASGFLADRLQKQKEMAAAGYALSMLSKIMLLIVGGSWVGLTSLTIVDRIGKGIRTAPRDAMIAASSPPDKLATAFGVHRAMDTAGAMLGPLIASALLWLTQSAYDSVFVVSTCFALVGLAVLITFVRAPAPASSPAERKQIAWRDVVGLLAIPRFRALVIIGALLSLVTLSDSLLHLNVQRKLNLDAGVYPLLFVAVAFVYMLLAVPVGRLADRVGRTRLFVVGYVMLLLAYVLVASPFIQLGFGALAAYVALLGCYYAATDGVLMALASGLLPEALRTTGLSVLTTATGLTRLLASVLFGLLWSGLGAAPALTVFIVALVASIAVLIAWGRRAA